MLKNITIYLCLVGCFLLSSCVSYKHIPYFRDLPPVVVLNQDIENRIPVIIQPGDILSVSVSSLSPGAELFAPAPNRITINTDERQPREGYLVNPQGEIRIPLVGTLKILGLNTSQITDLITYKLKDYLKSPVVNVRLINFNVSVFGSVGKPGIYPVTNERITVLEAIILAGDLSKDALKNNILLVREVDKKRQFIRLDIESKSIFNSPYFYLKNNDLIYIETAGKGEKREALTTNVRIATVIVTLGLLLLKFK